MADPTPVIRAVTYERDGHACVSCGTRTHLQYQHRATTGMGGSKVRPRYEDGVTSCATCNPEYERSLQTLARVYGWKLKKVKRAVQHPEDVPVFTVTGRQWFLLGTDGSRRRITAFAANTRMVDVYGDEWSTWVGQRGSGVWPESIATNLAANSSGWA